MNDAKLKKALDELYTTRSPSGRDCVFVVPRRLRKWKWLAEEMFPEATVVVDDYIPTGGKGA